MVVNKGTVVFRVIYGTLTVLVIAAVTVLLVQLWGFLEVYEKCRPEVVAENFIRELESDKTPLLDAAEVELNEFEDESVLTEYISALTNGDISYRRNGKKSDGEKTVYSLMIGGETIAELTVAQSDTELGYGLHEYEAAGINCRDVSLSSYTVTAPSCADVYINGKAVSEKYIIQKGDVYKETENFHGFFDGEIYDVTYKVDGFIKEPVIRVNDKNGNSLVTDGEKYALAQINDGELSQLALDFAKAYSKYIVMDGYLSEAAAYLAPNMPIYGELAEFENKWNSWHNGYDFLDVQVDDALIYSSDCASVRVSYDHVLYGVPSSETGELHSPADYTVYMVKSDGQWKVTELIFN